VQVKLQKIGNSLGVILPKEVISRLRVKQGDKLLLNEAPGGVALSVAADDVADQLARAREIMDRRRTVMKALAQ
jgi:putative addiction module antidote